MKKYLAEFIGTFFLVFIMVGAVSNAIVLAPVAIGLVGSFVGGSLPAFSYRYFFNDLAVD